MEKDIANKLISYVDHTSLNENDTEESIKNFCNIAFESETAPACLMTYPKFVTFVKSIMPDKYIPVATVINFPHGSNTQAEVIQEAKSVLEMGIDEVDMVMNYNTYMQDPENGLSCSYDMIKAVKEQCESSPKPVILKVILETGKLQKPDLIYNASMNALKAGADFIKTSTGKVAINATPEAAEIMFKAIKDYSEKNPSKIGQVGFKAAGGVKTIEDAITYMNLAKTYLGEDFANNNIRFGASSLLKVLLSKAQNEDTANPEAY